MSSRRRLQLEIQGVEIRPVAKSHGPNSNAIAYANAQRRLN